MMSSVYYPQVIKMDELISPRTSPILPAAAKRRRAPREKGRTPYDGLRPWSAITHGVGALLAVLGTVLLLVRTWSVGGSVWHLSLIHI